RSRSSWRRGAPSSHRPTTPRSSPRIWASTTPSRAVTARRRARRCTRTSSTSSAVSMPPSSRAPRPELQEAVMSPRRALVALAAVIILGAAALGAAQTTIRIGEINSFSGIGAPFTGPYWHGVQLAIDEVNARGSGLGQTLVGPNTYEQGRMLAEKAGKLKYTKWATIGPNYEYGKRAWETFRDRMKELKPDVQVVEERWPALGKIDAGIEVGAILAKNPEALYVSLFGSDWITFVRESRQRGPFDRMFVVGILLGEPEYIDPLGLEAPEGMLVTGYP